MKRKIITTSDGSTTIQLPEINEQYHSVHGAIQEAMHVFISCGLKYYDKHFINKANPSLAILEIGFGTGLNAVLTALENKNIQIKYEGVEAYPVINEELEQLNYASLLKKEHPKIEEIFSKIHTIEWGNFAKITHNFSLKKRQQFIEDINDEECFNIIYFDAFGARVQPQLWTESIFIKMYNALKTNGILVTYSAKGSVRRALIKAGFCVEKLPGPPGKREMLRAIKK